MGRRRINAEQVVVRLPPGTLARIDAVLGASRPRAEFLRRAVLRELELRVDGGEEDSTAGGNGKSVE